MITNVDGLVYLTFPSHHNLLLMFLKYRRRDTKGNEC